MEPRKLQHRTEEETVHAQQTASEQQITHEFSSAEEMLRHDAQQVQVPPAIAARLRDSTAVEPVPQKGWWHRLFRK